MNGGHDLGGMHGLGPINAEPETEERVFHAGWERRVFALVRAAGTLGLWTGDASRYARERQHPVDYLRHSYYENWLAGLEKLLVESGLVTQEELATGRTAGLADEQVRKKLLKASAVPENVARGSPAFAPAAAPPHFQVGDRVRAITQNPTGHTREPRYVRGHVGEIYGYHGSHILPDLSAANVRGVGRHLYNVRFAGRELWGNDASDKEYIYVDLWEDYLEPA